MSAQGIQVYHAPLEAPKAIGLVERHGGVLKGMARKVISQTQARGVAQILEMGAIPHLSGYLVGPLEKHHPWCPRISLQTSVR